MPLFRADNVCRDLVRDLVVRQRNADRDRYAGTTSEGCGDRGRARVGSNRGGIGRRQADGPGVDAVGAVAVDERINVRADAVCRVDARAARAYTASAAPAA